MKWLITGGCGFIGKNLVLYLLANRDHIVTVVDFRDERYRLKETTTTHLSRSVKFIDPEDVTAETMGRHDVVVHLAALPGVKESIKYPYDCFNSNVVNTFNYLHMARRAKPRAFIFASSFAAAMPITPYGASKAASEVFCRAFNYTYGTRAFILRFSNVYGPHSEHKKSVVASFIEQAMREEALVIEGFDGSQVRDFVHVYDVVRAITHAAVPEAVPGCYDIATGRNTSIRELAELIKINGRDSIRIDYRPAPSEHPYIYKPKLNVTLEHLKWSAAIDLQIGIRETIDWFTYCPSIS